MAESSVSTCRINWEMIFVKSVKAKCTSVVLSHLIHGSKTWVVKEHEARLDCS